MKRKNSFLAIVIALTLCLAFFTTINAFAVGEDETVEPAPTAETEYIPPETQAPETQAPQTQPPQTQAPQTQAPQTQAPETQAPEQTPQDNPVYDDNSYNNDVNNDYNNSYNAEERESNTTDEKAETSAVYDAENDDVSKETLKKGDWAKIAEQLKNSNGGADDDFAFIRNNDQGGSDNGEWMLVLGIAMEAVGVGIIIFLIVMKVRQKKAVAKAGAGGRAPRGGNGSGQPPRGNAPARNQPHRSERAPQPQRTTKKQRSKFDTADIELPKHAKKPSGGSRYKPRH